METVSGISALAWKRKTHLVFVSVCSAESREWTVNCYLDTTIRYHTHEKRERKTKPDQPKPGKKPTSFYHPRRFLEYLRRKCGHGGQGQGDGPDEAYQETMGLDEPTARRMTQGIAAFLNLKAS